MSLLRRAGFVAALVVMTAALSAAAQGHATQDGVCAVAFSPDGAVLASGGDQTIRLWDAHTGRRLRVVRASPAPRVLRFLPDGSLLGVGEGRAPAHGPDRYAARVWDPSTGRELRSFPVPVPPYSLSPDGALLATGARCTEGDDPLTGVALVDTATGREVARLDTGVEVQALAFSPDGHLAVYGMVGDCPSGLVADCDSLQIWDVSAGQVERRIAVPGAALLALAYSADGSLLAAGDSSFDSGHLSVWETATGRLLRHWRAHPARIHTLAFSADGSGLFSGARFGHLAWWPLQPGAKPVHFPRRAGSVVQLAVSGDGLLLAHAHSDWASSAVLVWAADTGRLIWRR